MAADDPGRRVAWVRRSPEGVGRAIAALAGDPELMSLTGQALAVETLAARYGVDVSA
jgi:hypothetical protein